MREKSRDDLALRADGVRLTRAAASGVLDREMECGRSRLIAPDRIGPGGEEELCRCRGARADGAMQRGRAIGVRRVQVRAVLKETPDRRELMLFIPGRNGDASIRGVVERSAAPAIVRRVSSRMI